MTTEQATQTASSDEPIEVQMKPETPKPEPGAPAPKRTMSWSNRGGMQLKTIEEAYRFAGMIVRSGWAPTVGSRERRRPMNEAEVFAAIQLGSEVGLPPMQSVQNIAVINGRPTIWGDAMLALCRMSGRFDEDGFKESFEGQPGTPGYTAVCKAQRIGSRTVFVGRFSVADALKAGLWEKPGPWQQYPNRMLQMRARSFCLRDGFSDVLCGLHAREEMTADEVLDSVDLSALDATPLPGPNGEKETRGEQVVEKLKRRREQNGAPELPGDAQVDAEDRTEPEAPAAPPDAPEAATEPETPPAAKEKGSTKAELVEKVDMLAKEAARKSCDVTKVMLQLGSLSMAPEHLEKLTKEKLHRGVDLLEEMIRDAEDAAEQTGA